MVERLLCVMSCAGCLGFVSCAGSKGKDSIPVDDGGGGLDTGLSSPCTDFEATTTTIDSWTAKSLRICVNDWDKTRTYRFGMVGVQVGDTEAWTGEDCVRGGTLEDGTFVDHCHPASADYSIYLTGVDPELLDPATQTSFEAEDQYDITYFLQATDSGDCWVWGFDNGVYNYTLGMDCTEI